GRAARNPVSLARARTYKLSGLRPRPWPEASVRDPDPARDDENRLLAILRALSRRNRADQRDSTGTAPRRKCCTSPNRGLAQLSAFTQSPLPVCPQRDSNPRYGLERAATWTASRWGPGSSLSAGYAGTGASTITASPCCVCRSPRSV